MEPENQTVIDVEAEQIDYPDPESIDQWYSAAQVQGALNLNKAALQKAIAKLTNIYSRPLAKIIRTGKMPIPQEKITLVGWASCPSHQLMKRIFARGLFNFHIWAARWLLSGAENNGSVFKSN